jgi:hypothetical protein
MALLKNTLPERRNEPAASSTPAGFFIYVDA